MTIATTTNKAIYQGNGATTSFPYTFLIPVSTDLSVLITDSLGNITTLNSGQYSVSGIGQPNGGVITYPLSGPPLPSGSSLTILRTLPAVQQTSVQNQSGFYPVVIESALDYLTMLVQQLAEQLNRSVLQAVSDTNQIHALPPASQRAGQIFTFDVNGNPAVGAYTASVVSTVMQPVVNAATLASAISALFATSVLQPVMTASSLAAAITALFSGSQYLQAPTVQVFTSNGTYTRPTGLLAAFIFCQGPGGAGGPVAVTTSGQVNTGGGGSAGDCAISLLPAATIGASQAIQIGVSGNTGTPTKFGASGLVVGAAGINGVNPSPSADNVVSGASSPNIANSTYNLFVINGQSGGDGWGSTSAHIVMGGKGGDAFLGHGGEPRATLYNGSSLNGVLGSGYGSGASGAVAAISSGSPIASTLGQSGICIVVEVY